MKFITLALIVTLAAMCGGWPLAKFAFIAGGFWRA